MFISSSVYAGKTEHVSISSDGIEANSNSYSPSISADGRFVAYESWTNNQLHRDTNDETDSPVEGVSIKKSTIYFTSPTTSDSCDSFSKIINIKQWEIQFLEISNGYVKKILVN